MKIVHLSTSDMGGAGIAAKRLHLGLLEMGVSSSLLTLYKHGDNISGHYQFSETIRRGFLKKVFGRVQASLRYRLPFLFKDYDLLLRNKPAGYDHFSFPFANVDLHESYIVKEADIIHLHWVADGMLDYKSFFNKLKKPLVWTLHDMNPFTGGCHHADSSNEFMRNCFPCVQVKNTIDESIARKNLSVKLNSMKNVNATQVQIITPSKWLGRLSKQSILFKKFEHVVIPNVVDKSVFKPGDAGSLRKELKIPKNAKVVLFVANDVTNPRKGISTLVRAFNNLQIPDLMVCTVGRALPENQLNKTMIQFGFVNSEVTMSKIYAISDVYVLPSIAENFPNSIVESFFCGVPVVSTRVGGVPEQINESNGIMYNVNRPEELEAALQNILTNTVCFDRDEIRKDAVQRFGKEELLKKHLDLYEQHLKRYRG
jgi:glycosyltransferase involved in cell wall biosynthesis